MLQTSSVSPNERQAAYTGHAALAGIDVHYIVPHLQALGLLARQDSHALHANRFEHILE